MIIILANHLIEGRVASATTIAVGDEPSGNPRITAIASKPRSGGTTRVNRAAVRLLRCLTERLELNAGDEQPAQQLAEIVAFVKVEKQPRFGNVRKIGMFDCELSSIREIDGERPERRRLQQATNLFEHGRKLFRVSRPARNN